MKISQWFMTLFLGLAGGFIAYGVTAINKSSRQRASEETLPVQAVYSNAVQRVSLRPAMDSVYNPSAAIQPVVDLRHAAKKAVPAVVHVKTLQMGREYMGNPFLDFFFGGQPQTREVPQTMGYGSGVIISEEGYIVTNNHVIEGSSEVRVTLDDKKEYAATVVGRDPDTDIALLKIEAAGLPYLAFADSDQVELGEWVLAVGNPYNLTSTVTAGIISAKARELGINRSQMSLESFLQTDAAVNPGNSGGALVDANGDLIGINTAIESRTGAYSGYSFAVPANIARKVVSDLQLFGNVQRAMLGITMVELSADNAKRIDETEVSGIYVMEVMPEAKADLQKGDIIKRLNGIDVQTVPALRGQLGKYDPGEKVTLEILRNHKPKTLTVTLIQSEENQRNRTR